MSRLVVVGIGLAAWAAVAPAAAYEFDVAARTVAQGYQVRRYLPAGGGELLNRRRLTQSLNLSVWDIEPDAWHFDQPGRNAVRFDLALRFDSDFGGYMLGRPRGDDEIRELEQNQVDVLEAALVMRSLAGRADVTLGRQIRFDALDFLAFDGGAAEVRLPAGFFVDALGGSRVLGLSPLSAPIFEPDGTSAGSRDARTFPAQNSMLEPIAGGGVGLRAGWLDARVGYRRAWSMAAAGVPGDASSVTQEKITGEMAGAWGPVSVNAAARYDALVGVFDQELVGVTARLGGDRLLRLEGARLVPTFDGDSIWNVFAAGGYADARATFETRLGERWTASASAFARRFESDDADVARGGRFGGGGTAGARYRARRIDARLTGYGEAGQGGRRLGGDAFARLGVARTFDLEGRLTSQWWRSDLPPDARRIAMVGAQVGTVHRLAERIRLHLLGENNMGTDYQYQLRGLAVLDVEVGL